MPDPVIGRREYAPELGDGATSRLESISQLSRVELDVPSTDGANNAGVSLCPTDRLVAAGGARRVQTHI